MPQFFIFLRNARFRTRDDGRDYANADAALAAGVATATILVGEEIRNGSHSAAMEITVSGEDGLRLLSSVVTTTVAVLLPGTGRAGDP